MKISTLQSCLLFSLAFLLFSSCDKEDQMEVDQQRIQDFILEHNLDADSTASGIYYVIDDPGSNDHPTIDDVVTVSYIGFLLNGDIFDNGTDVSFPLRAVIAGWQEGIPLFGRGGRGLLIIPSHLAYGDSPRVGIPANSVLVFEIHLKDF